MEKSGLLNKMTDGVTNLSKGRRALYIEGTEADGLKQYRLGVEAAISLFNEAIATKDPELMLLAEFFFTSQELAESIDDEQSAVSDAQFAVRQFEEALTALTVAVDPKRYHNVMLVFSSAAKYQYDHLPKDAFHVACISEIARLKGSLKPLGNSPENRKITHARISLVQAAQDAYADLQRAAIAESLQN